MFESYGAAARVYAFADPEGGGAADPEYREAMRAAIRAGGDSLLKLVRANAFGIPFSLASKRRAQAGWYWALGFGFDLAVAKLVAEDLEKRAELGAAVVAAYDYEFGANATNRAFTSGAGPRWRRQIVNRISLNDRRALAVPGISSGNVFSSPDNLRPYQIEGASGLRRLFEPSLADFAFYDRAGMDAYNVRAEGVTAGLARMLAVELSLMAETAEVGRPWKPVGMTMLGVPDRLRVGEEITATLELPEGFSLDGTTVVWELAGAEPPVGASFHGTVGSVGQNRLEAEVVWPDGRRAFAAREWEVIPPE